MAIKKEAGRPIGAPNNGFSFVKSDKFSIRCTEGFTLSLKVLAELTGKSPSDILHEALQQYCFRNNAGDEKIVYWSSKIL
jgi:predicted transcriptional regulator